MNLLSDIITYIRRLIKSPSNAQISDNLIIDYINRFWLMDVSARIQLFDLKTTYQFETLPGLNQYNMPLYNVQTQPGSQNITSFPVYQGFTDPVFINGIQASFYTDQNSFYNVWPNYIQPIAQAATGNGSDATFQLSLPYFPAIPGHLDITGILASGVSPIQDPIFAHAFPLNVSNNISIPSTSFYPGVFITYTNENGSNTTITDSGVFLDSGTGGDLYGLLIQPGNPPFGNQVLGDISTGGTYSTTANTVNYNTGVVNVTFPIDSIPAAGVPIQVQCYFYEQGIPRSLLFYNNVLTLNPPPSTQYVVSLEAYLTPAAFLSSAQALVFGYMCEYIARGAARKILSDTGDIEQFMFYEQFFKEQETLVWKRSQRQFTSTRTPTIYTQTPGQSNFNTAGTGTN